jgi:hypothetical protein
MRITRKDVRPRNATEEAQRRVLVGLSPNRPFYIDGTEYFDKLEAEGIQKLIELGLATPGQKKRSGTPALSDYLKFMEEHPGGVANGVVVKGGPVVVAGLTYESRKIDLDTRLEFVEAFQGADDLQAKPSICRCYYD